MLNEERIKLMTKLALYEQKEGKRDIPMSHYYKGDYVSYHMIRSSILATLGFLFCVAVWFAFHLSYFMEDCYRQERTDYIYTFYGSISGNYLCGICHKIH